MISRSIWLFSSLGQFFRKIFLSNIPVDVSSCFIDFSFISGGAGGKFDIELFLLRASMSYRQLTVHRLPWPDGVEPLRGLLAEPCDVVVDARLNCVQRVAGNAARELALGAGSETAGYVADTLDDIGSASNREISFVHRELE